MPDFVPDHVKTSAGVAAPSARELAEELRDVAVTMAGASTAMGHPAIRLAGAYALLSIATKRILGPALEWLGNDPESPWYATPVHLKRSHLRADPFLEVESAEVPVHAFETLDYSSASIRAMLRAGEREQGAMTAKDPEALEARRAELEGYRLDSSRGLHAMASSFGEVAATVSVDSLDQEGPVEGGSDWSRASFRRVLKNARASDSEINWVLRGVRRPDASSSASEDLKATSEQVLEVATSLEGWDLTEPDA